MTAIRKELAAEAVIAELRATNARLVKQLAQQKIRDAELVAAVYRAAKDAASTLTVPPVAPPTVGKRARHAETAVCVLSDWQLAKRTPTYNSEVCEERIERYGDKVVKLAAIQRADHPVREARIYLLGDIVEGELVFPGQAARIDASLYEQVLVTGRRILANFVRRMLGAFERVGVVAVIGNHGAMGGATRREHHPETNADAMLYETTRLVLQGEDGAREPRLTWGPNRIRGERRWYAVDYIGKHGFLLVHGDQVKGGFAGWPWYGFAKKVMGWRMGAVPEPFRYVLSGHFHTPVRMLIGDVVLWGNASTESGNTYAAEMLAAQGKPSQWLLFCEPERGVTAEYEVHLT